MASLDGIFFPASVAIAGVGDNNTGRQYLDSLFSSGFKGKIYPMNPRGGEIEGLKVFPNVKDIPGQVDYVVSCLPAPMVPQLIKDCSEKGAKVVSLFTAGFSELGSHMGRELEMEISLLARTNGLRVLGPNCMGVYCPKSSLSFAQDFPKESGSVALVCQSGGNAIYLVRSAAQRGVRFSKVISYGNGCDIDESDLFDYLAQDPETQIVTAYIEGVRDGARFLRALSDLSATKPVIVLKAGCTQDGARTTASHTGAMSGPDEVWSSLLQQARAIRVYTLEEMIDMMVTFLFFPVPRGRNVAVAGFGGGASVLVTDVCNSYGFTLPPGHRIVSKELDSFIRSEAGLVLTNPIELNLPRKAAYQATKALLADEDMDLLLAHCTFSQTPWPIHDNLAGRLADVVVRIHADVDKPIGVILVSHIPKTEQQFLNLQQKYHEAGLPVYHSMPSACLAIDRFLRYHGK